MTLTNITDNTFEPLTVSDVREHLRITSSSETRLLKSIITTARQYVERRTGLRLGTSLWILSLDTLDADEVVVVPEPPLQAVSSVQYVDINQTTQTVSTSVYEIDTGAVPGKIRPRFGKQWPTDILDHPNAINVTFTAGYASVAEIPCGVIHGMLLLIGHWYNNREDNTQVNLHSILSGAEHLFRMHSVLNELN